MKNRHILLLTVLMVTAGILIRPVVGQVTCPNGENYQPCTCSNFNGEFSVVCKEVSLKDVVNVFNRTTPSNLRTFTCFLSPSDASNDSIITIPTDLLKEHQVVYEIQIYSLQSQIYSLRIEPEAFRSSKNYTEGFYLGNYMDSGRLDLSRLDFDFLMGFHKLSTLDLRFTANVHLAKWTSLPPLPNLKSLSIFISTGLSEWDTFPSLVRGLEELYLHYNNIESVAMDRILNWTVGHSATTLENLGLSGNDLTSIPQQISSLISLRSFVIESQNTGIPLISSGSIKSYGSLTFFSAHSNGFETIESDAFQGNFSDASVHLDQNIIENIKPGAFKGYFGSAYVDLSNNKLKQFEELVFKEMLQQMTNQSSGSLDVSNNPLDCESDPCHLAWLIRDNRDLLDRLSADCSDGIPFKRLDPSAFDVCGITTTPPTGSSTRPIAHHFIGIIVAAISIVICEKMPCN